MKKTIQFIYIALMILFVSCTSQYTETPIIYEELKTLTLELPEGVTTATITEDGGTLKLDAIKVPEVTTWYEWKSSDTDKATVDGGEVTALANGPVTITLTDKRSKKEATQVVTITGQVVDVNDVFKMVKVAEKSPIPDLLFYSFLNKVGLLGTSSSTAYQLLGKEAFTIFVPSEKALEGNNVSFDGDMMEKIVKYHVVKGAKTTSTLGTEAVTLYTEGTPPTSNANYNKLYFSGTTVKTKNSGGIEANIDTGEKFRDVVADNGVVIHVIDKLLIPDNLKSEYDSYAVHPTKVTITTTEANLKIDTNTGTLTPTFEVIPKDTAYQKVKWSISSGSEYAKINANTGKITALKNGTVVILATALVGSAGVGHKYVDKASVVITNQSDLTILEGSNLTINVYNGTVKLSTNASPTDTVTWSILGVFGSTTNENNLVTVSAPDAERKVTVTAKSVGLNGTVVIQAESTSGRVAKITVEVIAQIPALSIKIKGDDIAYNKGNEIQLTATVYSDTASTKDAGVDQHVTWSSSDETIATVDERGKVTFVSTSTYDGTGAVTITANSVAVSTVTKTHDISY